MLRKLWIVLIEVEKTEEVVTWKTHSVVAEEKVRGNLAEVDILKRWESEAEVYWLIYVFSLYFLPNIFILRYFMKFTV